MKRIDVIPADELEGLLAHRPEAIGVSAKTIRGRQDLIDQIAARLAMDSSRVSLEFDDEREADRRLIADLYRHARVVSHVNDAHRVSIEADVPKRLLARFARAKVPA